MGDTGMLRAAARGWDRAARAMLSTVIVCTSALPARAQDDAAAAERPRESQQQVEPATKKLLAAHGLYQRGLFKLAAPEYQAFLAEFPGNAEATTAQYALAVCR